MRNREVRGKIRSPFPQMSPSLKRCHLLDHHLVCSARSNPREVSEGPLNRVFLHTFPRSLAVPTKATCCDLEFTCQPSTTDLPPPRHARAAGGTVSRWCARGKNVIATQVHGARLRASVSTANSHPPTV